MVEGSRTPVRVRYAKGNWQVLRYCCRSGQCFECRGNPKRTIVVQGRDYSKAYAQFVAQGWAGYEARATLMPRSTRGKEASRG